MKTHMVVLPGGGYQRHAAHEADVVAEWFVAQGIDASVCRYPVKARHPAPLEAVRDAIRTHRRDGADRVGLCGFSAGGHVAGLAALLPLSHPSERVDFVMLCYPVVSMIHLPHVGSRGTLIGSDAPSDLREGTSLEQLVHADAPPFFIWHTADDASVPVQHSYLLARALDAHDVSHELHVFSHGRHGLGLAPHHPVGVWRDLAAAWLREDSRSS